MAQARLFVCTHCAHEIEAWDDADPYYFDADGVKCYAYHPAPERALCTGIDVPHLCLHCAHEFKSDEKSPDTPCPACGSAHICPTYHLNGQPCPFCKRGTFHQDPDYFEIS